VVVSQVCDAETEHVLALWPPVGADLEVVAQFLRFEVDFEKQYANAAERHHRFGVFVDHIETAHTMNTDPTRPPQHTATYGVTKYADWTDEEFSVLLGHKPHHHHPKNPADAGSTADGGADGADNATIGVGSTACNWDTSKPLYPYNCSHTISPSFYNKNGTSALPPTEFDWRDYQGVVSAVKNQGSCGGCWAFSSAETVEAAWRISGRQAVDLSVQQILTCDLQSNGCCGGETKNALTYVLGLQNAVQGLLYAKDSKFECEARDCRSCASHCNVVRGETKMKEGHFAYIDGTCDCGYRDHEDGMLAALAWVGPMAVTVDAFPWKGYTGGVVAHHCGSAVNHAVQAVGYGQDTVDGEVIPYWIIKNSWGPDWGESGYIRLIRGQNMCGVALSATMAIVEPVADALNE